MSDKEKMALLEDMFELEEGTLAPTAVLAEMDEWDSLAKLSLIVLLDENFNKRITSAEIQGFSTVQDILDFMG